MIACHIVDVAHLRRSFMILLMDKLAIELPMPAINHQHI